MTNGSKVVMDSWKRKAPPAMTQEQFVLWQALIEARTGMSLSEARKTFVETSLNIRMREIELADYDEYYETLMAGPISEKEWSVLVDRLTVQETCFFRHASSYALVRDFCTDRLLTRADNTTVNLWSVGCSTGEEAYSLAIMMDDLIRQSNRSDAYYGITATDISLPTLAKARRGVFPERRMNNVSLGLRQHCFDPVSEREWQVKEHLRARIAFAQLNVMELSGAPLCDMDVIFCQNVLIYFRRWRKRDIVNHLAERLSPGGLLVLGVGEVVDWSHPELERVSFPDTLAYRRKIGGA